MTFSCEKFDVMTLAFGGHRQPDPHCMRDLASEGELCIYPSVLDYSRLEGGLNRQTACLRKHYQPVTIRHRFNRSALVHLT